MPPKAKKKAPAPAPRPRRTKTFRKLALAAATLAALGALLSKSRGAAKFQSLGAARYKQHLADATAASLQQGSGWKRGDDLGLTGRKAGTGHQHDLHGDVVRSSAFQEAAEGLAKDISTSRSLKPSDKLDAVTVGEGFLRHVNPRRIKFTRPMKLLGAAAAMLLALGSKDRLKGVVRRGVKSNKPFAKVYHEQHQGPGSFSRGVDLAIGDVSGSGIQESVGSKAARPAKSGDVRRTHLKGACRGGSCDHKEKYSDVLE